jgi:hypothetical protein
VAVKDHRSLYLIRIAMPHRCPELEAAMIHATSHDDQSVDYASMACIFMLERASSLTLHPLMWTLAHRAG